ncbi:MAG: serine/threonine-protein kinase [Myxococcales bacterium]|nr:serine/threonine protein kinase [Myxococcota bacterium]MDW8281773.1 serine/threonine-protein kinase [Myxococcales bacterium]
MSSVAGLVLPPPPAPSAHSLIGVRLGRYVITRELARGGMGVVYEAVHEHIGHRAAVKVLSSSLSKEGKAVDYAGRFHDEARAVNIVQHPGIVKIFDFGSLPDGTVYIMMEYLEGESLWDRHMRAVQRQGQRIPLADVLRLSRLIASALAAAHEKRILHRDLKPENVILVRDPDVPGGERTKVLDFGIARFMDSAQRRTVAGMVMGTAVYMAPEQCCGVDQLDGKVDVYALGVMMYELLAGRPPFEGEPHKIMVMHVNQQPQPLRELVPDLPEPVHMLVHGMLVKKPDERPSMADVVARIQQIEAALGLGGGFAPHVSSPHGATASLQQLALPRRPYVNTSTERVKLSSARIGRRLPLWAALAGLSLIAFLVTLWASSNRSAAPAAPARQESLSGSPAPAAPPAVAPVETPAPAVNQERPKSSRHKSKQSSKRRRARHR